MNCRNFLLRSRLFFLLSLPICLTLLGGLSVSGTLGCNTGGASFAGPAGNAPVTPASATGESSSGSSEEKTAPVDTYESSAPPISLPAPVTGRLTVTSPDGNYASLIIGDEQAVPSLKTVMAVNDTQAAIALASDWMTSFSIAALLDILIPAAAADAPLPDICSQPYHACGSATDAGSFEFALTGKIGDSVSISIIDATTGVILSETTHRVIPPNVRALPRRVNHVAYLLDAKNKKGVLYSLMSASGSNPNGLVEIRDLQGETSTLVDFDGPAPQRMDINAGNMKAAVIDSIGQFAAFVDLGFNHFNDLLSSKISIIKPTDVALSFDAARMAVTTDPDVAIEQMLRIVKTSGMTLVDTVTNLDLPGVVFPAGGTAVKTTAVDHGYFNTTKWVDVYAFVGLYLPNGQVTPKPYAGIVSDDGADHYVIPFMEELSAGCVPKDVAFDQQNMLLVTCGGIDQIIRINIHIAGADPVNVALVGISTLNDPNNLVKNPLNIVADGKLDGKNVSAGVKTVYVTVRDGDETHPDSVLTLKSTDGYEPSKRSDVGLRPTGIATPYDGSEIYISTEVSHAITTWSQDDLK